MRIKHVEVKLADNEWGNEVMKRVARDTFRDHPERNDEIVVVHINEHAGWRLSYLRCGTVVGSANDGAVYQGCAAKFREVCMRPDVEHDYGTPWVRR